MTPDDDDEPGGFASPPCFMHEIDPAYMGLAEAFDPRLQADVARWRKAERERLIAGRLALRQDERKAHLPRIVADLEAAMGDVAGLCVSAYWPFRGEPDLRDLMARVTERGGIAALPVVVARHRPLVFRAWRPGMKLERGVWNIPVPGADAPGVVPDIVIAPLVGFDRAGFRLGYGGGYYDRSLAAMPRAPRVFGVGYAMAALETIYPQPHDIPMDAIITEEGVCFARPGAIAAPPAS